MVRLLLIALLLCGGIAQAQTADEWFERGNQAYSEGRWAEAADAYRKVLDQSIEDARVHVNLGSAEFRMGRIGPSILHFEKARRLAPADREIAENLRFVQGFRFDRVEEQPPIALVTWIKQAQASVGVSGQWAVALALFWIAAAIVVAGLSKKGRFGPAHGWALAVVMTLLLIAIGSAWMTSERLVQRDLAVVMVPAADVVAGPSASNPTLLTVHEGLTVEILDIRPEWVQVALPNGIKGWLSRAVLSAV